ncbi:MAG: hypothetical protein LBB22_05100 [Treponema sp.]|jgi:hypothetical protein|nr:hypothetical protein [Treponema sp.]
MTKNQWHLQVFIVGLAAGLILAACNVAGEGIDIEESSEFVTRKFSGTLGEIADTLKTESDKGNLLPPQIKKVVAYSGSKRIGEYVFTPPPPLKMSWLRMLTHIRGKLRRKFRQYRR